MREVRRFEGLKTREECVTADFAVKLYNELPPSLYVLD
jgi:hypothetical protein